MKDENPWITKSSQPIYDNPWIKVTEHQVINPGGQDGIYGVVHFKNIAVGVIPLDEDYNTWIVGQYRYTLGHYSWEIPEGGGKHGISTEVTALRELEEETGIKAETLIPIVETELSNSVTDEVGIVYVAKGLSFHPPKPDVDEKIEIRKLPFNELFDMTMRGEIRDGLAVTGILKAKLLMESGEI